MPECDGTPDSPSVKNVSLVIKNPGCESEEDFKLTVPLRSTVSDLKQVLSVDYEGNPEVPCQKGNRGAATPVSTFASISRMVRADSRHFYTFCARTEWTPARFEGR
eukprot:7448670-Pyramimonas_sp.AAC.2